MNSIMPVAIEMWVGEPIIVLKPDAQVSLQEFINAWFNSAELAQTMEVAPHRIIDLRSINSPDRIIHMIQGIVKGISGASVDLPMNVLFVGSVPTASSTADRGEVWFETLDEALMHIRILAGTPSIFS
jgi:hypothetical protein